MVAVDLQASSLSKAFGDEPAVRAVSFTVGSGEIVSILGPSGCGKTTLLRMVAGLESPDAGSLTIGGRTVYRDRAPRISLPPEDRGLGMVFQDFGLWPHLTVGENVAFPLRHGRRGPGRPRAGEVRARVAAALEALRIGPLADKFPHQLSGGQQQRVAFARATVARPRLLLLDEPFNALDAQMRVQVREELLAMLRRDGFTVLHVTHDQEEALAMSDRILVMARGSILQYDTPENLYRCPREAAVAAFLGRSNLIPVRVWRDLDSGVRLSLPDGRTHAAGEVPGAPPRITPQAAEMIALLRPEDLTLSRGPASAPDPVGMIAIAGTVEAVEFLGDRYGVHVAAAGIGHMQCYAPIRVPPGTAVALRAPLGRVRLLPAGDRPFAQPQIAETGA